MAIFTPSTCNCLIIALPLPFGHCRQLIHPAILTQTDAPRSQDCWTGQKQGQNSNIKKWARRALNRFHTFLVLLQGEARIPATSGQGNSVPGQDNIGGGEYSYNLVLPRVYTAGSSAKQKSTPQPQGPKTLPAAASALAKKTHCSLTLTHWSITL